MIKKCPLCEALDKEDYLWEGAETVIIQTKHLKGHNKRIMIMTKKHSENIDEIDNDYFIKHFIEFCEDYFDEEPTFALVEPTYATIHDHWHRIACDWKGLQDLQQLLYTPHQSIATKVMWVPK